MAKVGGVGNLEEVGVLWEELNRVCVYGGCSGGDVAVVTTILIEGGANVPTFNYMCVEGGSVGGRFLD